MNGLLTGIATLVLFPACGARTGLGELSITFADAAVDARADAGFDARENGVDASDCPSGQNGLMTLATGQRSPFGLAVDDTSVYWTNTFAGDVMKIEKCGGVPTTLASRQFDAQALVADSSNVYWIAPHAIMGVSKQGGKSKAFASGDSVHVAYGLAVAGGSLFWINGVGVGTVMKVSLTGGSPTAIASEQPLPWAITANASSVYWTNHGDIFDSILEVGVDGGAITTIASKQDSPCGMTVDATNVYWTDAAQPGSVMKSPLGGGTATTLAAGLDIPCYLAVDATSAYWAGASGRVMKVGLTGGTPTTLASGQHGPNHVAVDATSVYWADLGRGESKGTIMRLTPK